MGSRLAKNTLAALAAFAVVALPVSLAAPASAKDDRSAATAEHTPAKPEKAEKDEPAGTSAKADSQATKRHGKPSAAPTTEPQPKSNADMNPGGANNGGDCGAYCSTRDGSPSGNGKGDGEAVGKPCAGCVGKADNKNPPGQAPDGTDHNAGYECDRNQGIGKTNPAHTGCTPSPTPTVEPTETPSPTPSECVPTNDEPCEPCVPTNDEPCEPCVPTNDEPCEPCVPTNDEPCETPTPQVSSSTLTATPTPSVKGVRIVRPRANPPAVAGGRLPTTGANASILLLLVAGFALVGLGMSITVATPSRHQH